MKQLHLLLENENPLLYYFGWICLAGTLACLILMFRTEEQIMGVNAWLKPFKFFFSSVTFVWSMALFMTYLSAPKAIAIYSWVVVLVLSFELIWISYQASKGETSHFNVSTPFKSIMWSTMGFVIFIMTLWTAYITALFFSDAVVSINPTLLWAIRIGLIFFVIFAMEGGVMGSKMAHTVGAPDGGPGLPLTNWSTIAGDLRIAHFAGMHALQLIPLLALVLFKRPLHVFIFSGAYFALLFWVTFQALKGKPLIRLSQTF